MDRCRTPIGLFLLALISLTPLWSQTTKSGEAVLTGTVFGPDGKPAPGAMVTCQSSAGMHPQVVHADQKGRFRISGLKQDSYDLRASWNGTYSDWKRNVPLRKGQTKDLALHLLKSRSTPGNPPPPENP